MLLCRKRSKKMAERTFEKGRKQVLLIPSQTNKTGVGRYEEILTHAMESVCNFTVLSPLYFCGYPFMIREEKSKETKQAKPILHITNQQLAFPLYMMSKEQRKRSIVTVHDVIPMQYPLFKQATHLRWKALDQFFFKKSIYAVSKAEIVICVSHATKKAFLAHVRYPEEKVKVVYEYPAPEFKEKNMKRRQYNILYVGSEMPHKNVDSLLKAVALVKKIIKEICLIKIGRPQWPGARNSLVLQAKELGISNNIIWNEEVDNLVDMYNQATILVLPSLHEGFGFPVVEAMACGCPVLCSSNGSLPELGGDAALYFNPRNEYEMAERIIMILKNKQLQRRMSKKGLKQVNNFTQKLFEEQMSFIYNSIAAVQQYKNIDYQYVIGETNEKRKNSLIVG